MVLVEAPAFQAGGKQAPTRVALATVAEGQLQLPETLMNMETRSPSGIETA